MNIKSDFVLHQIGDEYVVVPVNNRTKEFHGMIRLNSSGAYLWEQMQAKAFTRESLTSALLLKYDVDSETATKTVDAFIKTLEDGRLIEA